MPLLHSHFPWHKISSSEGIYSLFRICFKEKGKERKNPNKGLKKLGKVFFFILHFVWNVFAQGESCTYLTHCLSVSVSFYLQIMSFSVTLLSFLEGCIATLHEQRQRCHCVCCGYSGFLSHWCCPFIIQTEGPHTVCFSIICLSRRELSLKHTRTHTWICDDVNLEQHY